MMAESLKEYFKLDKCCLGNLISGKAMCILANLPISNFMEKENLCSRRVTFIKGCGLMEILLARLR